MNPTLHVGDGDAFASLIVTDEERALAAQLHRLDAADRAAWDAIADAEGWDDPAAVDVEPLRDLDMLPALDAAAHPADLLLLDSMPAASCDQDTLLARLKVLDKIQGRVAAEQVDTLVALAGAEPSCSSMDERHVEHELSLARGVTRHAAAKALNIARTLTTRFPTFLTALRAGQITVVHAAILVERTDVVTDPDALARIERLALPKAKRLPPGKFATEVAALVARFDHDATTRAARAREQRRVWTRQLDDGLGFLGLVHDWSTVLAIHDAITTDAHTTRTARRAAAAQPDADVIDGAAAVADDAAASATAAAAPTETTDAQDPTATSVPVANAGADAEPTVVTHDTGAIDAEVEPDGAWEDASLDACRADAFAARMLGDIGPDGSICWDRTAADIEVQLVIDLDTLRHEAAHPALLDGTPIPAQMGRDLAKGAAAWRRMVTDPVTGHLLDYGTRTYLPDALRTYVLARDGGCRTPHCGTRSPRRVQMDHAIPYPDGPSDPANTGGACTPDHQLKTHRYAHITDSAADGSATWTTAWGQSIHIPPRRYLTGSDPEPPDPAADAPPTPAPSEPDDIPPF